MRKLLAFAMAAVGRWAIAAISIETEAADAFAYSQEDFWFSRLNFTIIIIIIHIVHDQHAREEQWIGFSAEREENFPWTKKEERPNRNNRTKETNEKGKYYVKPKGKQQNRIIISPGSIIVVVCCWAWN